MTSEDRRLRRMQHVTVTGSALAVALGPLVVGALLARSVGADPMTSVNALIAGGGQRARLSRDQIRGCGGRFLRTAEAGVRSLRSARQMPRPQLLPAGRSLVPGRPRGTRTDLATAPPAPAVLPVP
ncbi:hypothetical protein ACIGBL_30655 [Streptomyces sp. NPDC085614]|uniref:hypothetical protein n=1 Tax=Streptomyces sp. NPDC085614 TaxID=3365733 RepID=UPI0037D51205